MSTSDEFHWTTKRTQAAQLSAEDRLTDNEIARTVGVTTRQLTRWKSHPTFRERVRSIVAETRAAILAKGIADKQARVDFLNERHILMRRVISERGDDSHMIDVPGGSTGLMVHMVRQIGAGPAAKVFDEYAVDVGLIAEMRAHEKQAAQELGQWVEKGEITGKDGVPLFKVYEGIDPDKV